MKFGGEVEEIMGFEHFQQAISLPGEMLHPPTNFYNHLVLLVFSASYKFKFYIRIIKRH